MIKKPGAAELARCQQHTTRVGGHRHFHHAHSHRLSRRQFLKGGTVTAGVTAGLGLLPGIASDAKRGTGFPSQVEGYSPVLESLGLGQVPFFLPIEADPFINPFPTLGDSSTINNFNGFVGVFEAEGKGPEGADGSGAMRTWASDVRFMDGVFADRQGRVQRGTFGFF